MKVNTECFNKFIRMMRVNEEVNLFECRHYLVLEDGDIIWIGEYHFELTHDAEVFERKFNVRISTLLGIIKNFTQRFIWLATRRADRTPWLVNEAFHREFVEALKEQDWLSVEVLLQEPRYTKALYNLVCSLNLFGDECLDGFSENIHYSIIKMLEDK